MSKPQIKILMKRSFKKTRPSYTTGFYLVEIIVAASIIIVVVVAIFVTFTLYLNVALTNTEKVQASYLAEEGVEALKTIRDRDWNLIANLTAGTTYNIAFGSGIWQSTTTPVYIDNVFERQFVVERVLRDSTTKDIGASGGDDADARKVTVTVNWLGLNKATSTISIATYITDIHQ